MTPEAKWTPPTLGRVVHYTDPQLGSDPLAAIVTRVVAPSKTDGGVVHLCVFPGRSAPYVEIGVPHQSALAASEKRGGKRWAWPKRV